MKVATVQDASGRLAGLTLFIRSDIRDLLRRLLVVRPHSEHTDNPLGFENLIDQPVLNIDAA